MKKKIVLFLSGILCLNFQPVIACAENINLPEEVKEAYWNVILQEEEQYGEYTSMNYYNIQYGKGVCYLELKDVNKDGIDELFIVHNNGKTDASGFPAHDSYKYELWTYSDGQANLLETDGLWYSNGGFPSVCWTEYEGTTYLMTNYQNVESCWFHGFFDDGSFGVVDTFLAEFNGNGFSYSLNGVDIDETEWTTKYQSYLANEECVDLFCKDEDNIKPKFDEVRKALSCDSDEQSFSDADENDGSITGNPKYDEIIRKYYRGVSLQWGIQEFSENGLCYLAGYEPDINRIGYCVLDIDNNGVDELLIGLRNYETYVGMFYDLYTMSGDEEVLVASSGERDRYYICSDNSIANEGSGGAGLSLWCYYDLNGTELEPRESILNDGYYDEINPWFYSNTDSWDDHSCPITEDYASTIRNSYEYKEIPFIPLSSIDSGFDESNSDNYENTSMSVLKQQALQEIDAAEQSAEVIENRLQTDGSLSQADMNQLNGELYTLWDDVLNSLWSYLKQTLSVDEMDVLTQDEIAWINEKEKQISAAGMEFGDGSLRASAEASTGASLTKERVYYLVELLP